jgi:tetratricopeptide (TPR) repeat protein
MTVLHIDLRPHSDTHATLRYGWKNLNRYTPRTLALAEIQDLITVMERDYYVGLLPENFVTTGQRLYRWLDGSDRWLERTLRERRAPLIALAIAATGKLAHLPWEVLHDGNEFLVAKRRPTVVPLRWCDPTPDDPRPLAEATDSLPNRALNLLFMATAPEGVQPELRFEEEEARILQATAKHPLGLQVEESGCLEQLADLYGNQPAANSFDAVHITGHADHSATGPIFLTETAIGSRYDATAADLADVFGYRWPRLLWLSGCRTGERLRQGDVPSLAEALIAEGADAVLGWGRPVLDTDGTAAAAALYGELAAGTPLLAALALTRQTLLKDQARDWHLLRLYVAHTLPGALVTPRGQRRGQSGLPRESAYEFLDPDTRTIKVPTRANFVGRRRPLQHCLRALRDPSPTQLGVVITGMGGYGKSSLAARICDRLPEFDRRVWIGPVDERALTNQLADWLDDPQLRQLVTDDQEALKYRLRKVFRALAEAPTRPLLLVLDDFEQNLEADCATLKPAAADCLDALLSAITEAPAPHRLLITCRYEFAFFQWQRLFHQPIAKFKPGDWQKKCAQLAAFQPGSAVPSAQQQRAITLADGNPRLVEWLDKVLTGSLRLRSGNPAPRPLSGVEGSRAGNKAGNKARPADRAQSRADGVDVVAVLDALEQNPTELREQVLAATLLDQIAAPMRDLLQRGRVFALPVPLAALREISADIPGLEGHLARALALGLLETDHPEPDLSQPHLPVRVPRVLPLEAVTDEALAAQAAQVLYRLWWQEADSATEAQKLEIHRLALAGKVGEVAAKVAGQLANNWNDKNRYREVVRTVEATLPVVKDHYLLHGLARAKSHLGDMTTALEHFQSALDVCPDDDEKEKAAIIHHLAIRKANQGQVEEAIALYQQSLEIKERIGNAQGKAATLHQLAILKANQGDVAGAIALYQQSLEINERIGDAQGTAATLCMIGQMLVMHKNDFATAIPYLQDSLAILQRIGSAEAPKVQEILAKAQLMKLMQSSDGGDLMALLESGDEAAILSALQQALGNDPEE